MKKMPPIAAMALILSLVPASTPSAAGDLQTGPAGTVPTWILNGEEYFERPGVSVLVFHDVYPEGKQGGLEIIQHGERVAALGDVRLEPAPGQWGKLPAAGKRSVDRAANRAEVPLKFEKEGIAYRVRVEPDGEALSVTVDLERPLPKEFAGRAGFNLELFPSAYFGKTYHLGRTDGVFPRQGNGPNAADPTGLWATPLAEGPVFTAAAEDSLRRLTIESLSGDLRFFDGRSTETNGWFLVRSLIRPGATKGAIRWRITPNAVASWRRPPVIGLSQIGYHPLQDKRAVIELDPRTEALAAATLLKVDPAKGLVPVLERAAARWGRFLRYDYATFDFSAVREPGSYVVRYGQTETPPFLISPEVYRHDVWQPTLETFLPVQMCHIRVIDRGRIWHGACHMDDALQAPPGLDLAFIEGYKQGPETETAFAANQHLPGLDRGGWHDAADHDLAGGAQAWATMLLALARETFGLASDQTTVDRARLNVTLHVPDGKPDILQQVAHGVEYLLAGCRVAGHSIIGISDPSLEQYGTLGEPASLTDNRVFDASLKIDQVRGDRSGRRDDRYAFTGRDTGLQYATAAALAAASRVLRGYDDAQAEECLATAVKIWDYERGHEPIRAPNPYVPERADVQEVLAAAELLITTKGSSYAARLKALLPVIDAFAKRYTFGEILPVSGLTGEGVEELLRVMERGLPEHPPLYPPDIVSDHQERFFVAEIIREKIFIALQDELPYSTTVDIVEFKERARGKWFISADVYVERDSQKGIVIGKGGTKLREIGSAARRDIEAFLQNSVFLELHVKVREGWRDQEEWLKRLGYGPG